MGKAIRSISIKSMPKMSEASSSSSSAAPSGVRDIDGKSKEEVKGAALCLAEAFKHDDVAMYFVETDDTAKWDQEKKDKLHFRIMKALVHSHAIEGRVTTVGPNYDSVALWVPPGKEVDSLLTKFRNGWWHGLEKRFSKEGKERFYNEFMPLLHDTKEEVLGPNDKDSWYLVYLGTKSGSRGKGYAKMLIEDVTKEADAKGQECYLESSNDINPKIYAKYGFQTIKKIQLTRGPQPVELDVMVRHPASKAVLEHRPAVTEQHHHDKPDCNS